MSRILYIDAFSGISGDMTVGALISLGVDLGHIEQELRKLPVKGFGLRASSVEVHGIRACRFTVEVDASSGSEHPHEHRHYREIREMLRRSDLQAVVKDRSLSIFARLAEAEGRVHGVAQEDVTFHEVGAIDSIVDIVATAIGLADLAVDRIYTSALPMGSGLTESQHGVIPVPGPATVELLKGFSARFEGPGELVTPTGAAVIAALAEPGPVPPIRIEAVGYGAGTRVVPDRPNVLRLLLGQLAETPAHEEMVVIETNIDDSNPELYEYVMEELLSAGARDVWLTPIQMKKSRPGVLLHVLAEPGQREALSAIILRETSSIGVRLFPVERLVARRESMLVKTEYGEVAVKLSHAPDGTVNIAPEYESCREAARRCKAPLKSVYQAAISAARLARK